MPVVSSHAISLIAVLAATAVSSPVGTEMLTVDVLACPATAGNASPVVEAQIIDAADSSAKPLELHRNDDGMYRGATPVIPGHYVIGLRQGKICRNSIDVTVLRGIPRTVGTVLLTIPTLFEYRSYLAGSLPMAGISRAVLVDSAGREVPLELDRQAYYGEHLQPGKYLLELSVGEGSLLSRIPVEVANPGTIDNVGMAAFKRGLGFETRTFQKGTQWVPLWP